MKNSRHFYKVLVMAMLCFFSLYAVGDAARGGSRIKAPSAPKATQKAPVTKTDPSKDSGYKASAPANSYSDKAPAANAKTPNSAAAAQSSSPFGGFMRSVGMFAGGMMLGSLLGSMFGMNGFMTDILGLLMNVLIIGAVVVLAKMLWNKFRNNDKPKYDDFNRRR